MTSNPRFYLIFYVPPPFLILCKEAIFDAGAGCIPDQSLYTECCWSVIGTGQFRPGPTADPHIGEAGSAKAVETPEVRVETLCVGEEVVRAAVQALKRLVHDTLCKNSIA